MSKQKILLMHTGGTISQKRGSDGVFRPSDENYLDRIQAINELADITFERTANIDSTNMDTSQRATLAQTIHRNHRKYDDLIILIRIF